MALPSSIGRTSLSGASLLLGLAFLLHAWWADPGGDPPPLLRFAGSLHPVVLHLPIGLGFALLLRMAWGLVAKPKANTDLVLLWAATCLFASLSYLSGWLLASEGGFDSLLLERHLKAAGVFTAFCWVGLTLSLWNAPRPMPGPMSSRSASPSP